MGKKTGLICCNALPIYVGDKFHIQKHPNGCCEHWIICEVRENPECSCGFGLYDVKTGEFVCNAAIATYRVETS
jgi:hypothetical protein